MVNLTINKLRFNGNVGIGTDATHTLSVLSTYSTPYNPAVKIKASNNSNISQSSIGFFDNNDNLLGWIGGNIGTNLRGGVGAMQLYVPNNSDILLGDDDGGFDFIIKNDKIGIGTSNPTKAKLEISEFVNYDPGVIGYLNAAGTVGSYNAPSFPYSIYASNVISGQEFHAHSDQRIKSIKSHSDNANDLTTLMKIKVTDYQMKDTIAHGNRIIKKVIAQQVAAVYPQAVNNSTTEVVPDIYQKANLQNDWIVP